MVSEKSTLSELTQFLLSSLQEKEQEVQDILSKRENYLKDEMKKVKQVLENELEKQRGYVAQEKLEKSQMEVEMKKLREDYEKERVFVDQEKRKIEKLTKSQMEFEVKMNELKRLRDDCEKELEKMKEHCGAVEKEGALKQKLYEDEVKKLREDYDNELEKERGFVFMEKNKVEKLKEQCDALEKQGRLKRKMFEDEVKRLRDHHVKELKKLNGFVAQEKLKQQCDVVEKEGYLKQKMLEDEVKRLRENYEEELEKVAMEKSRAERWKEGYLNQKVLEDEVKRLRENYEEELEKVAMEKSRAERCRDYVIKKEGYWKNTMLEDQLQRLTQYYEEESDLMRMELSKTFRENMELEEKVKQHCDLLEKGQLEKKLLEDEVKKLRENYEKSNDLMQKNLSLASVEKREFEEKMKESVYVLEKGHLKQKMLEDEVKRLREFHENKLENEGGNIGDLDEQTKGVDDSTVNGNVRAYGGLSMCKLRERAKMARESERFEMERKAMQKNLKTELEKLREYHKKELEREINIMENKLSGVVLEKLTLEEELMKVYCEMEVYCEMIKEGGIKQKMLEDEMQKSRENYEEELKRERDISENKLTLAASEKMNHEEELNMRKMELEDRIEGLERKNSELEKELELYKESVCIFEDFVERMKGVYDSPINGNVRANEEKRSSFLENESEDGGYNENNLRCKKRRIIDGSKGDKDSPTVEENTERVLESVCYNQPLSNDFSRKLDAVGPDISEANIPPRFIYASINLRTDNSGTDKNSKIWCPELVSGAVDGIGHCSGHFRLDSHVVSSENKEVAGFQTSKATTWSRSADILNGVDIQSTTTMATFLVNNDVENKLSRSVLEVQQYWPHGPCPSNL